MVERVTMEPGIAIPILPARDLDETRAFYERLGFGAVEELDDPATGLAKLVMRKAVRSG